MGATNSFSGKFRSGTFAGGQGPVMGQTVTKQSETGGVLNPATSGRNLKAQSGSSDLLAAEPKEKNFDLQSKPYAAPGNIEFKPDNKGEVSNQP